MTALDGMACAWNRRSLGLLAFLAMAHFSTPQALAQLSDSFSQSALNGINSDLSAEIIAGSTNTGALASPFYLPLSNLNMLPSLVGSTGTGGLENLLKVSIPAPFFSGPTYSTTGLTRASPALTTGTSLDGRTFTPALWNVPLLLPVTSGSDYTPALATGTFTVPNWILVARDGSNPATWSPALLTSSNNSSTVIGRYAYAIYHEGGLLDANVAGYPSTSSTVQIQYKPALPYADLTQIGLTPSQIDTLVGWRNYASTQAPGTPTAPDFTTASAENYYQFVLSNTNGYLSPSTAQFNGQTDQIFTSRQQLIDFMQNTVGLTGTGLNALNYLATFTRGVNQPSFAPDPTRPLVTSSYLNGGNDVINIPNGPSYEVYDGSGNYDPINPAFLTVLATGTFTRNDGSTAVVGEPLVNKRFPLNRLAWITYLGPSATRFIPSVNPGPGNSNYDMWQLVNVYGISPAYLAQGTPANIYANFGLVWAFDPVPVPPGGRGSVGTGSAASYHDGTWKWFYAGHNTPSGGTPGTVTVTNSNGAISRLGAIASLGSQARDPDFFELLKAGVMAGSIAKSSVNLTTVAADSISGYGPSHPYYWQGKMDTNLDYAIIQLGANIIDQAKVDGYSTRIVFNDGTPTDNPNNNPPEFRGVENLPYLYRTNSATMKLRMANPDNLTKIGGAPGAGNSVETAALKDPGVAMIMEIPTIWNPYDASAPLGDPAPAGSNTLIGGSANFRLIADSTAPDYLAPTTTSTGAAITTYNYTAFNADGFDVNQVNSDGNGDPSTEALWTTGTNGTGMPIKPNLALTPSYLIPLVPSNTQMTFQVPYAPMFREPTVLALAGYPLNSNLELTGTPSVMVQNPTLTNSKGQPVYTQGLGFLSDGVNPLNLPGPPAAINATTRYIGICAALYPVEFAVGGTGPTGVIHRCDYANLLVYSGLGPWFTYRLQYQSPNPQDGGAWITYDEKYTQFSTAFLDTPFGTNSGNLANQSDEFPGGDWQSYVDPRTSRFSAINGRNLGSPVSTPGATGENVSSQGPGPFQDVAEWADQSFTDGIGPEEVTDRPDFNAGYPISVDRTSAGSIEYLALSASGWTLTTVGNGHFRTGMLSQNSASIFDNGIRFNGDNNNLNGTVGDGPQFTYYSDPDGVLRGAMGIYQPAYGTTPATDTVGLPLATAYTGTASFIGNSSPYQGQSRPYFLHRPFRSVAELSYVFSGTPWKNIDFFTPQSGDAPLLDLFTINETPPESSDPNDLVAGTVNLNTHQAPVLQALLSGAYVDEAANAAFPPVTGTQANAMLTTGGGLIGRTTSTVTGQGPLQNLSELSGKWNSALSSGTNYAAAYTGLSADLTAAYASAFSAPELETMQNVQRFRESFIRPLAAVGNTRVWNLMIDLVVQKGQYPLTATTFDNFSANCEQRYWLHEAIDRYTGQIVDQSVETVGPGSLSLTATSIADNLAAGTTVATLSSSELLATGTFTYTLVTGTGANDNAGFTINGNLLQTTAVFDYLTKSSYKILISVTDANGLTYIEPLTINVQPGPYTQWKIANFGANSTNPAIAGDTVDAENDGLPNLLKYALGKSPNSPSTTGITIQKTGATLTMNYTRASAATDVTVTAATTTNLSNPATWTTSGVTQTILSDNGTIQQWQATAPLSGNKALFMQLTVSRP